MATSDLAVEAARNAMNDAGVTPDDIDLVIVATTSPDHLGFPSVACLLQQQLGLRQVGAFDLAAACSGFGYALTTGAQFVQTGFAKKVLVVGADSLSKWVDWTDRGICILFGDGAGAVVLGEVASGFGLLASDINSNGAEAPILMVQGGGTRSPLSTDVIASRSHLIHMEGRAVFKVAVNTVVSAMNATLQKAGLTASDIDLLIPHQANFRIIDHLREKLKLSEDRVFSNISRYGNTSAASIPIAIEEAVAEGRLKRGDILATVGFGAGFTWATNIIRWGV
jgi:3-oxoacyl-[acyl-carrier-protein] synthase-3